MAQTKPQLNKKDYLEISTPIFNDEYSDYQIFCDIIDMGIDSHLEAFTKSIFYYEDVDHRQYFFFHNSEISILLRRLSEILDKKYSELNEYNEDNIISYEQMNIDNLNVWIDNIAFEYSGYEIDY